MAAEHTYDCAIIRVVPCVERGDPAACREHLMGGSPADANHGTCLGPRATSSSTGIRARDDLGLLLQLVAIFILVDECEGRATQFERFLAVFCKRHCV